MSIREWVKGLFEPKLVNTTIETIPWPIGEHRTNWTLPQIDNEPILYTDIIARHSPEAGDILLEGTNGDVLMADNSGGAKWTSLPSAGLPRDKYSCPWCGGYTFDDYLGQCAACGGPRDKPIEKPMLEFNPIGQYWATSGMSYPITTMCSTCEPIELGIRFR